jgi:hypothetical protein
MGRILFFLIVVAAVIAGVWFKVPGGQDMLLGAKDKAMSFMPGKADDAAPADVTVDETVAEDIVIDDIVIDDVASDEPATDEAPAAEEAPQN